MPLAVVAGQLLFTTLPPFANDRERKKPGFPLCLFGRVLDRDMIRAFSARSERAPVLDAFDENATSLRTALEYRN
jgi:hypothetical protein